MSSYPSVSVIIAAASASVTLPETLEAIAAQDYPGDIEVVVAAADASTAEAARQHAVTVVENLSGTTPVGLNLAARASTGAFLLRVDAHSVIPPHYVSRVVETLQATGAANVGGRQVPAGTTFTEKAVAAAMASPFGAGDATYRVGGDAGPADTVYLGAFPRRVFEEMGGYDERFVRNQDYDLNHRIRSAGGVVWFDPGVEVAYRPRSSLTALAGQYFHYGRWKRFFAKTHSWPMRPRQLAPPLLVSILIASLVGSLWWPWLLWLPAAYFVAIIVIGIAYLPRIGAPALLMPMALVVMHITWGIGFLLGQRSDR